MSSAERLMNPASKAGKNAALQVKRDTATIFVSLK